MNDKSDFQVILESLLKEAESRLEADRETAAFLVGQPADKDGFNELHHKLISLRLNVVTSLKQALRSYEATSKL